MRQDVITVASGQRKRELREQVEHTLLPRAFTRKRGTLVWLDPKARTLALGSATAKSVELILAELKASEQVAGLPARTAEIAAAASRIAEAEAFYTRLGFVPSDRYPGRGVFLRCAAEGAHHNLFLLQLPNKPAGINHVAFAVRDIHEVFGGGMASGGASIGHEVTDICSVAGQASVFFVMVVAAAEVTVGLAIVVAVFRRRRSAGVDELSELKG